jgi:GH35 family endo-1,4-beta-xylanase
MPFKRFYICLLFIAALISSPCYGDWKSDANARIEQIRKGNFRITTVWPGGPNSIPDVNVQISQIKHQFAFGTAINYSNISNVNYQNFIKNHFEWAVCEDASKWYTNEPTQGSVTYTQADTIYDWCAANDIIMRGHNIFWDRSQGTQSWVKALSHALYPTPSDMLTAVQNRMDSAVNHFKGKFVHWDVDNEMLAPDPQLEPNLGQPIWYWMFQTAHAIDPNCKLFVNEYSLNPNSYINLVNVLLNNNAPVQAIGYQSHLQAQTVFQPQTFYDTFLQPLAAAGLPIWATEFDTSETDVNQRADNLEKFFRICFSHSSVEGIIMWSFWESAMWRTDAYIVNTDWSLNAAGQRYESLMNEWTTNDANTTDSNGNTGFRGFYGKYRVTLTSAETEPAVAFIDVTSAGPNEFTIELTPLPAAPTGLSATAGDGIVWLDWNNNSEADLAGYNIYRSTTPGSGYSKLNTSLRSSSYYTDNNAANGTPYYYVVTAVDTSSNESHDSNEVSATPGTAPGAMGTILREWWLGITGGSVSDLTSDPNFPDNPTSIEQIKILEGPTNWADSYGTRISGYLYPPATGSYTFWIASDANSQLWLSTDGNPENAQLIASVSGYTNPRQWDKYSSQESSLIALTTGKKYYIEVLHKEDTGNDNIAVAWEGPGITPQQVIYGKYLSPWFTGFYGDFTNDSKVDTNDLADFTELWLQSDCQQTSALDLDGDCIVNFYEFSVMAENWLKTIVPSAPANLSITTAGETSVSLDWDDNSGSFLAGYNVYRSTTSGSGYSKLNGSLLTSSDYTDNTAANGTVYYYVVTAVNIYSSESAYSNEVSRLVIQESTTGFCSVDGSVKSTNSGYTGAGYADTTNASGKGVNWRISVPSNGTYTLAWRYANPSGDKTGRLLVNDVEVISSISFPSTGDWTIWTLVSVDCYLTAGTNNIRLEATSSGGLANIDYLMVTSGSASIIPLSCSQ